MQIWIESTLHDGPAASFAHFQVEEVPRRDCAHWQAPDDAANILSAVAAPLDDESGQPDFSRAVDVRARSFDTKALRDLHSDARIWLWTRREYAAADALHSQAAQAWMENVGEKLANRCAEYSGGVFAGFYLRIASLWPEIFCPDDNCFPWSELLPPTFAELHGYELSPQLPALVANTGDEAARVRQHFWATVAHLQNRVWSMLDGWAKARGLQAVRVLPHEANSLQSSTQHAGDVAALLSALSHIAVEVDLKRSRDNEIQIAHLAASVAALRADGEVWCELREDQSGATPAARLETLHRLMRRGVTRFVLTAEYSAAASGEHSELHQPYFEHSAKFCDYLARCGQILGQGRAGARIGVLWPGRSAQAHYHPGGHRFARWVSEDLGYILRLLDELRYDYILLPEDTLCAAHCDWEKMWCGQPELPLEMVIIAGVTTLSRAAWEKIEEFVGAGGKAACLGLLPRWSESGRDREREEYINKTTLATIGDSYQTSGDERISAEAYPIFHEHRSGGRLCCYQPMLNPDGDDARRRVRQILRESLAPDIETQADALRYSRRAREDGVLFFALNDAAQPQRARLRLRADKIRSFAPRRLDAWTGETQKLPVWMAIGKEQQSSVGGGIGFTLDLAPHEAALILLQPAQEAEMLHAERANFQVEEIASGFARGYMIESGAPAVAIRSTGRLHWRQGENIEVPAPLLLSGEWNVRRLGPNVWQSTQSALNHLRLGENVPRLFLVTSRQNNPNLTVILNGLAAPMIAPPYNETPPWNDDGWLWFDLGQVNIGDNEIEYSAAPNSSCYLVGEFELDDEFGLVETEILVEPQPLLLNAGSWHEQGLPFYAGALEYAQTVPLPDSWQNCRIFLEVARARDVIALKTNGQSCGVRLAAPYRWDVTQQSTPGSDCDVQLIISNTTAALTDEEPPPSGLFSAARLVAYPNVAVTLEDEAGYLSYAVQK